MNNHARHVTVTLLRDGNAIGAVIASNLQEAVSGWGNTAPEALRDLAPQIEQVNYPLPGLEEKLGPKLVTMPAESKKSGMSFILGKFPK